MLKAFVDESTLGEGESVVCWSFQYTQRMPWSQIKREPDDFLKLRRFKDFRHRPGVVRFLDILFKQFQIKWMAFFLE